MPAPGLTPPPAPATLEPQFFAWPLSMPVGITATKVLDADLNRMGVWVVANAPTQGAVGQVSAPAITTNVAAILNMPAGLYDVTTAISFEGGTAVVGTDSTNWRLVIGKASAGTGQTVALLSCPISNGQVQTRNIRVSMPGGGQDLFLASVAAPTAAVIYQGDLAAIPLTPVFLGMNAAVSAQLGFTGWPVGIVPQFLACNQELWAIAPVSGASGALPAVLYLWEVRKKGVAGSTVPYEGT